MSREPDSDGGRELGDGSTPDDFDSIVADWRREGSVPQWPADDDITEPAPLFAPPPSDSAPAEPPAGAATPDEPAAEDAPPPAPAPAPRPQAAPPPSMPPAAARPAHPQNEDHFVPPEPPPLPRLGPPALVGLGLLALGLALVVAPGWIGIPEPYGLPLGLLGLAAGLGWLVLRLWPDAEIPGDDVDPDDDDDGAVL